MAPKKRRKTVRRAVDSVDELDVHAGKLGFTLKGLSAKRWSMPIVMLLIALAFIAVGVWTLKSFPQLLDNSKRAADKGVKIEQKLDNLKISELKFQKKTDKALVKLTDAVETLQDAIADKQAKAYEAASQTAAASFGSQRDLEAFLKGEPSK